MFLAEALAQGYRHEGSPVGFMDDPAFAALRNLPRFKSMASEARTRTVTN
jgi:hypothetical protein